MKKLMVSGLWIGSLEHWLRFTGCSIILTSCARTGGIFTYVTKQITNCEHNY